ncbi:MAG: hypothetical protein MRZ17_03795 [Acholeplasmataceae bacterium]|nr:hypothetical protein [Acholeplasmataceae bacterium]
MKKLTRKITLSLVAILFAVIALGTTTYAWFTLGSSASISSINANVTTVEGLEISNDGTNWYNELTFDKNTFQYNNANVGGNVALSDLALVSAKGASVTFNNSKNEAATANADYLVFDLYVRGVNIKGNKKVTVSNVQITSEPTLWTADATIKDTEIQNGNGDAMTATNPYNFYASNAARLSFAKDNKLIDTFERETAQYSGETKQTNDYDGGTASTAQDAVAQLYAAKKHFELTPIEHVNNDTVKTNESIDLIANITNEQVKVQVYVWLNGFDGDCINAILGGSVSVSFQLNLATA